MSQTLRLKPETLKAIILTTIFLACQVEDAFSGAKKGLRPMAVLISGAQRDAFSLVTG